MIDNNFFRQINIFVPLAVALTTILITSFELLTEKKASQKPVWKLFGFFVCAFLNWGTLFFYFYFPTIFAALNALVLLSFIMAQVFFYGFVFHLTQTTDNENFPVYHYFFPLAISGFLFALMLITPFDEQVRTIQAKGSYLGGSYLFHLVSNSKLSVRLVVSLVYTFLCFYRLFRYRRFVADYSSNYEKSSLNWVQVYLFLALAHIPIPLIGVLFPRDAIINSALFFVQVLIMIFQYSFVCFHIIKGNYIVYDEPFDSVEESQPEEVAGYTVYAEPEGNLAVAEDIIDAKPGVLKKQMLNKEEFDAFMTTHKPFVNPNLKIPDLASELNTNRSYLSAFINQEYGVNFSKLINRYRLAEFYRIREEKKNLRKSEKECAEIAGFGSYKNFKRFLETEENLLLGSAEP
jgi:AraC-like DNA-binding protein